MREAQNITARSTYHPHDDELDSNGDNDTIQSAFEEQDDDRARLMGMTPEEVVERCLEVQVEILTGAAQVKDLEDERVVLQKDLKRERQAKATAETQAEESRDLIGQLRHEIKELIRFEDRSTTAHQNAAKYKGLLEPQW
jgi:hypothetical protein